MKKQTPPANRSRNAPAVKQTTQAPLQVQQSVSHIFEGPLPPPSLLENYDTIVPGMAARLLDQTEKETAHRHEMERMATMANVDAQRRQLDIAEYQARASFRSDAIGQAAGFVISAACAGGAIYLAITGSVGGAAVLMGLPLAGIIRALRSTPEKAPPKK